MQRLNQKATTFFVKRSGAIRVAALTLLLAALAVSVGMPEDSVLAGWAIGGSY